MFLHKIFPFLKQFIAENKNKQLFKPIAVLVILFLIMLVIQVYKEVKPVVVQSVTQTSVTSEGSEQSNETSQTTLSTENNAESNDEQTKEKVEKKPSLHIGKFNIIAFVGLSIALAVVKYREKKRLELKDNDKDGGSE